MCDSNVGVAKRLDLETISKDISDLVKELDEEVQVSVHELKKIKGKIEKILEH
jgi:hypothetical protein